MTLARPLAAPFEFPTHGTLDLTPDPWAKRVGIGLLVAIAGLYVLFW